MSVFELITHHFLLITSLKRSNLFECRLHLNIRRTFIRHLIEQAMCDDAFFIDDIGDGIWNPRLITFFRRIKNPVTINDFVGQIAEQGQIECAGIFFTINGRNQLSRLFMRIHADANNFDALFFLC